MIGIFFCVKVRYYPRNMFWCSYHCYETMENVFLMHLGTKNSALSSQTKVEKIVNFKNMLVETNYNYNNYYSSHSLLNMLRFWVLFYEDPS